MIALRNPRKFEWTSLQVRSQGTTKCDMSKLQEIEPLKKKLIVRNGIMSDMEPTSGKCPAGLPSKFRMTCKFYLEICTLCQELRLQKLSFEVHSSNSRTDFILSLPHSKIFENIHNASEELKVLSIEQNTCLSKFLISCHPLRARNWCSGYFWKRKLSSIICCSRFHQTKYLNKLCITSSLVDKLELKCTRMLVPPVLCLVPLAVS